jgi:hypothetical protein
MAFMKSCPDGIIKSIWGMLIFMFGRLFFRVFFFFPVHGNDDFWYHEAMKAESVWEEKEKNNLIFLNKLGVGGEKESLVQAIYYILQ